MSSIRDRISLLPQLTYQHVFRAGGGDEGSGEIDFTVFSVAVTTLGLILCVELIRHRLDLTAIGRPFMKTVLEGVYRELATLGIVEFFIFLLHKYYEDLNIAQELVFADVHFTLFFTALFNAIQSIIMAFFVSRHSDRLWVQTEYQDLHHYVEIREEFDRIEKELLNLQYEEEEGVDASSVYMRAKARRADASRSSISARLWSSASPASSGARLKRVGAFIVRSLNYPALTRKHHALLVQVRFHELKFHFLKANNLPITMHVSDYMKRCELHILQSLVHISTFAWLLLTGGINLLYFLMGVVVYTTDGNLLAVGKSLTGLYFFFIISFVALSLIIWYKMNWIFTNIMHMKLISQAGSVVDLADHENEPPTRRVRAVDQEGHEFHQKSLFWGGQPKYITVMIQFMQFGFALALSILLVFWDDIGSDSGVAGGFFILGVLLCYGAFVYIISHVVPRYTLCTSVGQMVDQRRLHETLARHRLEQAQREREQAVIEQEMEKSFRKQNEADMFKPVTMAMQSIGNAVLPEKKKPANTGRDRSSIDDNQLLEKLVMTNTKELRSTLPQDQKAKLDEREQRMLERRNRRKTLSDGVEAMRNMVVKPSENDASTDIAARRAARRQNRRKSVSASASIQMMRAYTGQPKSADSPKAAVPLKAKDDSAILADERAKRRANRKKTTSASADIRMMRMATLRENSMSASDSLSASNLKPPPPTPLVETPVLVEEEPVTANVEAASGQPPEPRYAPPQKHVPNLDPIDSLRDVSDRLQEESEHSIELFVASRPDTEEPEAPTKVDVGVDTKTEAESDDDDRSDVDDLPEVQDCDRLWKEEGDVPKASFSDHWRSYFRGRVYVIVSAVFGTMVIFFFIGMRLESMLIETGVLLDLGNTWNFDSYVLFWLETAWLALLVIGDAIILFLFKPSKLVDNRDRSVAVSAALDALLALMCMGLLMGAQVQRCCNNTDTRWLAGEKKAIQCCPAFGHRLYGGVGDLEMFTSLIALRLLRFLVAGFIVRRLDKKYGWSEVAGMTVVEDRVASIRATHPFDPLYDKTKRGIQAQGKVTLGDERGTMVELWKSALVLFPDIVEKHGEFSGELLQAMLGIAVIDKLQDATPSTSQRRFEPEMETVVERSSEEISSLSLSPITTNQGSPQRASRQRPSLVKPTSSRRVQKRASISADRRYSGLSPDAQSIIMAGKLGKPVRPRESKDKLDGSSSLGRLLEDSASSVAGYGGFFGESQMEASKGGVFPLEFELSPELGDDESAEQFFSPNARLIRSMRRCDRKVMPLLGKWTPVDMVMTKYEIVYFDATDIDNIDIAKNPSPHTKHMQDIRQALRATKGGKGLRLRDVAYGRRVVGHQEIKSIDIIHVERILPHIAGINEESGLSPDADEFWKDNNVQKVEETERPPRDSRWALTEEDRLKLETRHDTIYLRFYSDLEHNESKTRMQNLGAVEDGFFKNNAFQYCQTLGRLVGSTKLKQDLPHFGEDNTDELRDYLVVVEPNSSDDKATARFKWAALAHRRQKSEGHSGLPSMPVAASHGHRRQQSEGHSRLPSVAALYGHRRQQSEPHPDIAPGGTPPRPGRRSSSFESGEGSDSINRSKAYRRTHSAGDGVDSSRSTPSLS